MMDSAVLVDFAADDGQALLAAAERDWTRPIAHCPGWDTAELVRHTGSVLAWMAAIVSTGQRQSRRALPAPPSDVAELSGWYTAHLADTVSRLRQTDPDAPTWTFSTLADTRVGWWRRRLAVEIAVHRWDAEHAAGRAPSEIDGDVAATGVAEFMTEFLAGLLTERRDIAGTLHLHATDGDCEWWADLGAPGVVAAGHRRGDLAVRATRSDLLLWLMNRAPSDSLQTVGDSAVAQQWSRLSF